MAKSTSGRHACSLESQPSENASLATNFRDQFRNERTSPKDDNMDFSTKFESGLSYSDFLTKHGNEDQRQRWAAVHEQVNLTAAQRDIKAPLLEGGDALPGADETPGADAPQALDLKLEEQSSLKFRAPVERIAFRAGFGRATVARTSVVVNDDYVVPTAVALRLVSR